MAIRKIPDNNNPWICNINGVVYSYSAGEIREVPDDVASLIDTINAEKPKSKPKVGVIGQVWTLTENGEKWADIVVAKATTDTEGIVKMAVAVDDPAGEAPTAAEFKALLDALRDAGIIAPSVPSEV